MAKQCVERDLLRLFKRKNEEEIVDVILQIANGTYKYEVPYMNSIPYNVMILYIEKIIVLGTKRTKLLDDLNGGMNAIVDFANHIKSIRYSEVDNYSLTSLKYNGLILLEKAKKTLDSLKKPKGKYANSNSEDRIACLLMAGIILINMYSLAKDKGEVIEFIEPETSIGQTLDRDETLGYVENLDETISQNIYYEDSLKEVATEPVETIPEKSELEQILEMYNLTEEELDVIIAIAITESNGTYKDAYAVINTMWNRTVSKTWINYINSIYGQDVGKSLYYQAITPGQFVVYEEGRYLNNLGVREGNAYQAIIDFLLTQNVMHNFLSFKSANTEVRGSTQFVSGGNNYHNEMDPEDKIELGQSR